MRVLHFPIFIVYRVGSLYLLFYALTPKRYRVTNCRKWPGAAFVAAWWVLTTSLLPVALSSVASRDGSAGR